QRLREYLKIRAERKEPDPVEAALGRPPGTLAYDVLRLAEHTLRRAKATGQKSVLLLQPLDLHEFEVGHSRVGLRFLTPGTNQQTGYEASVVNGVGKALAERGLPVPSVNPNLASGAILLEYGQVRMLLMADAEREVWDEWAQD